MKSSSHVDVCKDFYFIYGIFSNFLLHFITFLITFPIISITFPIICMENYELKRKREGIINRGNARAHTNLHLHWSLGDVTSVL